MLIQETCHNSRKEGYTSFKLSESIWTIWPFDFWILSLCVGTRN